MIRNRSLAGPTSDRRVRSLTLALFPLLVCLFSTGAARATIWLVPSGGEVWTAGTTHTVAWSGGTPAASTAVTYHPLPLSMAGGTVAAFFPNAGYASWAIPPSTPPGQYKLQIGYFSGGGDPVYSETFTIVGPPECLSGCYAVSASLPESQPWVGTPPSAVCGASADAATAAGAAYIQAQLESQCSEGYSVDPGSLDLDVTFIPVANCLAGTGGDYLVDATATGCCCPDAVPAEVQSWSNLKARYR